MSHLSVVLDLAPAQWAVSGGLSAFVTHVLVFLNAHLASDHSNSLAVFGAFPGTSRLLYASSHPPQEQLPIDPNSYSPFKQLDHAITSIIQSHLDDLQPDIAREPSSLVSAITKALCHLNRISTPPSTAPSKTAAAERDRLVLPDPRLLILSVSPDLATSYIPIMNSVFSAQKLKVTIDVCQVYGPDAVFLQQAAHLTGGSYIHLERRDALLQYLIMAFLPPPAIRKIITVPTQDKVDFRAACFCHKNIVDIGYVCSVCLSIFCHFVPVCSTCRTKFKFSPGTLQRLNQAARPPPPSGQETPRSNPGTPRPGLAVARSTSTSAAPANSSTVNQLPQSSAIGLGASNGTSGRSFSMGAAGLTPVPNGTTR